MITKNAQLVYVAPRLAALAYGACALFAQEAFPSVLLAASELAARNGVAVTSPIDNSK